MVSYFDSSKIIEAQPCNGFDLKGVFLVHMLSIDYGSSFNQSLQLIEGTTNNQSVHEEFDGKYNEKIH